MKATIIILVATVFSALCPRPVQAAADGSVLPETQNVQGAIAVWQEYLTALHDRDEERAKACWTEKTRQYPVIDWQIGEFDRAVAVARHDSLVISDARESDDHVQLLITSPGRESTRWSGSPDRTYYVIQAPEPLLANPVEILTAGWQESRTAHIICHHPTEAAPTDDQLKNLEEFFSETSAYLDIESDRAIEYFYCNSDTLVGALFGMGPATARAANSIRVVAAVRWTSFHELVHVLLGQTCRRQPVSAIFEGAACYFGGATLITRDTQLTWAKALVANGEAMPLATLLDEGGFWKAEDMNDPYAEAAAFTGFLLENYGVDAYKSLYRYRDGADGLEAALEAVSGKNVAQLDAEWKEWLLQLDSPTIGLGIDEQATEIFRMDDPPHDDNGDGHYVYPLGSEYKPGMFDLTGFRVLSKEDRLYFELTYRDLVEWKESAAWGFGGTYTRIGIDCGGQRDSSSFLPWDARATAAGSCDYLINVSDCGVQVWQDGRVTAFLNKITPDKRLGDAARERIGFSIPCTEPQAPRRSWRCAVAVGGCTDRGRHFRDGNGGFLTVAERPSEHAGGGGGADGKNPNLYDILLPAGEDQRKILSARPVILPMVGN